jgi:hypothetical protein
MLKSIILLVSLSNILYGSDKKRLHLNLNTTMYLLIAEVRTKHWEPQSLYL